MKALIVLVLSCVSAVASDTGIRVVTTVSTNAATGVSYTVETFKRSGQTDLIRTTTMHHGIVELRYQSFYHRDMLVAKISEEPGHYVFLTTASPYTVALSFSQSKDLKNLTIDGKGGRDMFYATNGVYYPASNWDLGVGRTDF